MHFVFWKTVYSNDFFICSHTEPCMTRSSGETGLPQETTKGIKPHYALSHGWMCSTHRKPLRAVLLDIWKSMWNELTPKKASFYLFFFLCGLLPWDHKGLIFRYLGKEETMSCYCAFYHIAAIPGWAEVVCKKKRRIILKKRRLRKPPTSLVSHFCRGCKS